MRGRTFWLLCTGLVLGGVVVASCGGSSSDQGGGAGKDASADSSTGGSGGTHGSGGSGAVGTGGSGAVGTGGSGAVGTGGSGAVGTGGSGGTDACAGVNCDDGVACTVDGCLRGVCTHTIDPTGCPADRYCDALLGCVPAPACATTQQCIDKWANDACKTQITCEPATSTCRFVPLDKDHDGHSPIVCGGDDCNDASSVAFAGNAEVCDGIDNDCNGQVDDGDLCGGFGACTAGTCACPTGSTFCGAKCTNTQTDNSNCGFCGKLCQGGTSCVGGICCTTGDVCGGQCVDKTTNNNNCGTCGHKCVVGESCVGGQCQQGAGCNAAFCPSTGVGTPCCITSNGPCGVDYGMGCVTATGDGGP